MSTATTGAANDQRARDAGPLLLGIAIESLAWIENGDWSNGVTDQHGQGDEGVAKSVKFIDRLREAITQAGGKVEA